MFIVLWQKEGQGLRTSLAEEEMQEVRGKKYDVRGVKMG